MLLHRWHHRRVHVILDMKQQWHKISKGTGQDAAAPAKFHQPTRAAMFEEEYDCSDKYVEGLHHCREGKDDLTWITQG
jgi:hypothetical protein